MEEMLNRIYERLGGMDAKLDAYHDELKELKPRVAKLETNWAKLMGILGLLVIPFAAIGRFLKHTFSA